MNKMNFISIFLILINFLSYKTKEPSKMLTIPLKYVKTSYEKYPTAKKIIEEKIPYKTLFGTRYKTVFREVVDNVTRASNYLFLAPINLGGQEFNVVLDTGSINLWVAKINSTDTGTITKKYDPSKSISSTITTETFEITYGTGSTKGNYYCDFSSFISGAVYNLIFGAATQTDFKVDGAQGIMGLAREYSRFDYSAIWTLNAKKYIPNKSFSFKYYDENHVEMYIGGEHSDFLDQKHTASCQLLKRSVYDHLLWTCKLYNFGLALSNKKNITVDCGFNFLFDTGSNVMRLPKETLGKIQDAISLNTDYDCKTKAGDNAVYLMCNEKKGLPDIFIEVGNHSLILRSNSDNLYTKGEGDYQKLNIQFMDVDISLIGQPFFRIFHTRFDPENKLLKFYSKDETIMKFTSNKPNDDTANHFDPDYLLTNFLNEDTIKIIACVAVCIAILFTIFMFYKFGKKCLCKKDKKHSGSHHQKHGGSHHQHNQKLLENK